MEDTGLLLEQIVGSIWESAMYFAEGKVEDSNRPLGEARQRIIRIKAYLETLETVKLKAQSHVEALYGKGNVETTASELEKALKLNANRQ